MTDGAPTVVPLVRQWSVLRWTSDNKSHDTTAYPAAMLVAINMNQRAQDWEPSVFNLYIFIFQR